MCKKKVEQKIDKEIKTEFKEFFKKDIVYIGQLKETDDAFTIS